MPNSHEEPFATVRVLVGVVNGWCWLSKCGETPYMYGPGSPFNALKHRDVSSTRTGPPTCNPRQCPNEQKPGVRTSSAAFRHFASVTSSTDPWISSRSSGWLRTSMAGSRMARTSRSLFAFPVMKLTTGRPPAMIGTVLVVTLEACEHQSKLVDSRSWGCLFCGHLVMGPRATMGQNHTWNRMVSMGRGKTGVRLGQAGG